MTNENEEAIKNLKKLKSFHNGSYGTAIDTAIKALEQTELNPSYNSVKSELKPSEDCISRAYIEPIIEELENICVNGDEYILSLLSDIKNAPSVTPTISKKEQVDDCISRAEALRIAESYYHAEQVAEEIRELPSVEAISKADMVNVFDKIRAEIEQIDDTMGVSYNQYVSKIDVLQIIDKYKAESEE